MKDKLRILMKNEVLTLIIGILIGAVVTTSIFLIIRSGNKNNVPNMNNMPMNENGKANDNNFKPNSNNSEQNTESDSTETESDTE